MTSQIDLPEILNANLSILIRIKAFFKFIRLTDKTSPSSRVSWPQVLNIFISGVMG